MASAIGLGAALLCYVGLRAGDSRGAGWRRLGRGIRLRLGSWTSGATRKAQAAAGRSLERRVRARVAPLLAVPEALETRVEGDRVVLRGPVRPGEVDLLLASVWRVRGVRDVDVRLELYDAAGLPPVEDAPVSSAGESRGISAATVFRLVAAVSAGGLLGLGVLRRRRGRAGVGPALGARPARVGAPRATGTGTGRGHPLVP